MVYKMETYVKARVAWAAAPKYTEDQLTEQFIQRRNFYTCPSCGAPLTQTASTAKWMFVCIRVQGNQRAQHKKSLRGGTIYHNSRHTNLKWYKARIMLEATDYDLPYRRLAYELGISCAGAQVMKIKLKANRYDTNNLI